MICVMLQIFGWCVLFSTLQVTLDSNALALCLGTFALSEVLGLLISSGLAAPSETADTHWQDALERLLGRWVVVTVLAMATLLSDSLAFFHDQPMLTLACLALSLCIGVLRLTTACRRDIMRSALWPIDLRWPIFATVLYALSEVVQFDGETAVGLAIFTTLLICLVQTRGLFAALRKASLPRPTGAGESVLAGAPVLLRYLDLLMAATMLAPPQMLIYICARCIGMAVGISLMQLSARAQPGVAAAFQRTGHTGFVAAAARLNLGMLLVGGAIAIGVLGAAPYVAGYLGQSGDAFREILFWVVVAQSAPALFGAGAMLLDLARYRREVAMIHLAGVGGFCIVTALSQTDQGLELARHYAALQSSLAACMAGILAWRTGIWPGPTAVLFRQIKLF